MRADDLAVCHGKALQLQVWLLFTEVWAQSQGILALSYTRLAIYTLVLPQGFAEVQLRDELQQPLCCGLCHSLLSFSTASALSCLAHHSLGEVMFSCFGRRSGCCRLLSVLLLLQGGGSCCICPHISACWLPVRVSKKPITHTPDNQQIN